MSKISGILPPWTTSLDIISEPPRTKYSGEPELYRFLARTKVCREIFSGTPGDWLIPTPKTIPGRTGKAANFVRCLCESEGSQVGKNGSAT